MKFNKGDKVRIRKFKTFSFQDLNNHKVHVSLYENSIWNVVDTSDCKVIISRGNVALTLYQKELALLCFESDDLIYLALNKLIMSGEYTRQEIAATCDINYCVICDMVNGRRKITKYQASKLMPLLIETGYIKEEE